MTIIETLLGWLCTPSQVGYEYPSNETIHQAITLARKFPEYTRVVPDANGGIVLSRKYDIREEEVHVWNANSVELIQYECGRIVLRQSL